MVFLGIRYIRRGAAPVSAYLFSVRMAIMMQPANRPSKPRLTIRRLPGDFSDRQRSVLLAQGTCCCCCCLHWIGAAAGAIVGSVAVSRSEKKEVLPIHPEAKGYVLAGAWIGFFSVFLLIIALIMLGTSTGLVGGLAFMVAP